MLRTARIGVLGALLALTMAVPVMAEEDTVVVTQVKLDRTTTLTGSVVASIRLTGTITCNGSGPADFTTTTATQGEVKGQDNWDLYWFACSTEPRAFTVVVESLTCDPDFAPEQCFTAGVMRVEVAGANGQPITSACVVARAQGSAHRLGGGSSKVKRQGQKQPIPRRAKGPSSFGLACGAHGRS